MIFCRKLYIIKLDLEANMSNKNKEFAKKYQPSFEDLGISLDPQQLSLEELEKIEKEIKQKEWLEQIEKSRQEDSELEYWQK